MESIGPHSNNTSYQFEDDDEYEIEYDSETDSYEITQSDNAITNR